MISCLEYVPETVLPTEAIYKLPFSQKLIKTTKDVVGKSNVKRMEIAEQMLKVVEKVFTVNPHYMTIFANLKTKVSESLNNNVATSRTLIGRQAYCSAVHTCIVDHLSQLCEYWLIRNGTLIIDTSLHTFSLQNS